MSGCEPCQPATPPTLAGFQDFVTTIMGIDPVFLPAPSPYVAMAFRVACQVVNRDLAVMGGDIYSFAVYNLAGSVLLNIAQDQAGRTYFKDMRKDLSLNAFTPGLLSSTGDNGTSSSFDNPKWVEDMTIANLQQSRDPYGRAYLAIAQSAGYSIVGLS